MKPLVSVIIPTYNRIRWLPQAIESITSQTYEQVEIIVVDDGSSTVDPHSLVDRCPNVRYIYQENQGLGAARNTGLRICMGTYVQFLDDDDWLTPDSIARKIDVFQQNPDCGVVYSDLFLTDEPGNVREQFFRKFSRPLPRGDIYENLIGKNFVPVHSVLWKRSVLEDIGGFPMRSGHEDWECLIRAAEIYSFEYLDRPLGYYRIHHKSLTRDFDLMFRGKNEVNCYMVSSPRFAKIAPLKQSRLLSKFAFQQWAFGNKEISREFIAMARKANPSNPFPYFFSGLFLLGRPLAKKLLKIHWQMSLMSWEK